MPKIDEAFIKNGTYKDALEKIKEECKHIWKDPVHNTYSQHGMGHSERIIEHLNQLSEDRIGFKLSETEQFILIGAIYLHDIGMQCPCEKLVRDVCGIDGFTHREINSEERDLIRKSHNELSRDMILHSISPECVEHIKKVLDLFETGTLLHEYNIIAQLCFGHVGENLGDVEEEKKFHNKSIRVRLLQALLRIGDALDADDRRINTPYYANCDFERMHQLDLKHYLKHRFITSVNKYRGMITFVFTFPEELQDNEIVESIVKFAVNDIQKHESDFYCKRILFLNDIPIIMQTEIEYQQLTLPIPAESLIYDVYKTEIEEQLVNGVIPINKTKNARYEFRDSINNGENKFLEALINANSVVIIGLTNENLAEKFLKPALVRRRRFWESIKIISPSKRVIESLYDQHTSVDDRISNWTLGKKTLLNFFSIYSANSNWEILEYDNDFPFLGNMLENDNESVVRMATLLPGLDMKDTFYNVYDVKKSEVIEESAKLKEPFFIVQNTINKIISKCSKIDEWIIKGRMEDDNSIFKFTSIFNSIKPTHESFSYTMPVVLVMLHTSVNDEVKVILQKRTDLNASSDLDKYSNISGKVEDLDIFAALQMIPSAQYDMLKYDNDVDSSKLTGIIKEECNFENNMPNKTFRQTAVREVGEEIGLTIKPDDLSFQTKSFLQRDNKSNLFFKIFTLEIESSDLEVINERRPYSNLNCYSYEEVIELKKTQSLNGLLQNKFDSVFRPIYDKLFGA